MASQVGRSPHLLEQCWTDFYKKCEEAIAAKDKEVVKEDILDDETGKSLDCFTLLKAKILPFLEGDTRIKCATLFQDKDDAFSVSFLTKSDGTASYRGRITCIPNGSQSSEEHSKSHVRIFQEVFDKCMISLSVATNGIRGSCLEELNTLIIKHSFSGIKSICCYIEETLRNSSFQGKLSEKVRQKTISESHFKLYFPAIVFSDRRYGLFQADVKTVELSFNTPVSKAGLCWDPESGCIIDHPTHLESDPCSDVLSAQNFRSFYEFSFQRQCRYEISIEGCISEHLFASVESILAYLQDPRLATVESVDSCIKKGEERGVFFTEFPAILKDGRTVRINAYTQIREISTEARGLCWNSEKACLDCTPFNSIDLSRTDNTKYTLLVFCAEGKQTTVIAHIS